MACRLWCVVLVCSWRRLLADRHLLPFPLSLCLHRRWCPSASHHPVSFLFLLALSFPLYFPFLSVGLCLYTFPFLWSVMPTEPPDYEKRGAGGRGEGGLWDPKVCEPMMAQIGFPNGKLCFSHDGPFGPGGGGPGGLPPPLLLRRTAIPKFAA